MATTIGTSYGGDLNRPGYTDEGGITGIREQLNDIISDISPTETPFYTKCGKENATNTYVEWQTAELRAPSADGEIEGADTGSSFQPTVRVGNYTRIGKEGFKVSGTATALDLAGRDKEYAYQALQAGKALKRDQVSCVVWVVGSRPTLSARLPSRLTQTALAASLLALLPRSCRQTSTPSCRQSGKRAVHLTVYTCPLT